MRQYGNACVSSLIGYVCILRNGRTIQVGLDALGIRSYAACHPAARGGFESALSAAETDRVDPSPLAAVHLADRSGVAYASCALLLLRWLMMILEHSL